MALSGPSNSPSNRPVEVEPEVRLNLIDSACLAAGCQHLTSEELFGEIGRRGLGLPGIDLTLPPEMLSATLSSARITPRDPVYISVAGTAPVFTVSAAGLDRAFDEIFQPGVSDLVIWDQSKKWFAAVTHHGLVAILTPSVPSLEDLAHPAVTPEPTSDR